MKDFGIVDITGPEAAAIINDYIRKADGETVENERLGQFICQDRNTGRWIAIDNRDGDAWTEEFKSRAVAIKWLLDVYDTDEAHEEDAA